jgi:hypothetical protein
MFTTHPAFKHPMQLDEASTMWSAVELEFLTPWFLATVSDAEQEVDRTFQLSGCTEVLLFAEREPLGKLIELTLVLPPTWSSTEDWQFVKIKRVDRVARPREDIARSAVVVGTNDITYGGFPVSTNDVPAGPLIPVLELPDVRLGGKSAA